MRDDERDEELDWWLTGLREPFTDESQMKRWQAAVQRELAAKDARLPRRRAWVPIATAAAIGFCLGALTFAELTQLRSRAETTAAQEADRTVRYIYARSEMRRRSDATVHGSFAKRG